MDFNEVGVFWEPLLLSVVANEETNSELAVFCLREVEERIAKLCRIAANAVMVIGAGVAGVEEEVHWF